MTAKKTAASNKPAAKKTASSSSSKPKTAHVGHTIEVPDGAEVERPNGDRSVVTGGYYVVNIAGTYKIDGQELEVK